MEGLLVVCHSFCSTRESLFTRYHALALATEKKAKTKRRTKVLATEKKVEKKKRSTSTSQEVHAAMFTIHGINHWPCSSSSSLSLTSANTTGPVRRGSRAAHRGESPFYSNTGDSGCATSLEPAIAATPPLPASSSARRNVTAAANCWPGLRPQ